MVAVSVPFRAAPLGSLARESVTVPVAPVRIWPLGLSTSTVSPNGLPALRVLDGCDVTTSWSGSPKEARAGTSWLATGVPMPVT